MSWTTVDQELFLQKHLHSYVTAAESGSISRFWDDFIEKWFDRFPLEEGDQRREEPLTPVVYTVRHSNDIWKCRQKRVNVSNMSSIQVDFRLTLSFS